MIGGKYSLVTVIDGATLNVTEFLIFQIEVKSTHLSVYPLTCLIFLIYLFPISIQKDFEE